MARTSKFNASISTLGISEPKVQQAIMKLLENSLWQRDQSKVDKDVLEEELRRVRQKLSTIDFDIDEQTAQKIADKISAAIGDSVRTCTTAATTATNKAGEASESAQSASEDAAAVAQALADMEGTIEQKAQQAAETAISQVTQNVQQAVGQAQSAAQNAQNAATAATTSANNAATTAGQASAAAQQATQAVQKLTFRGLATATTYNASNDQYRKIATLPAVSSAAGASITFFGSLGGWTESSLRQVMVSICQSQSGTSYETIDAIGYCFRASLPASADICIYKESNNTFSVYLKGVKATYFKHNIGMIYNEQVAPIEDTFRTNTPTGTLVWNLLAHYKVIATSDEITTAITNLKAASNTWSAAQTFSALITANGKIASKGTSGSWYQGRDLAAFKCQVATTGYVPTVSCKSSTGSWELGTYTANNDFHLVFITDENYTAKNNVPSVNVCVTQDGQIYGVKAPAADSNGNYLPTTAWVRTFANGAFQPKGSYAAADHNHDSTYQPKGSYAASTIEKIGWAHVNQDLAGSTYMMSGLVSDAAATYNVNVTFRNTSATARSCKVNSTTVSLAAGDGKTASNQFTVSGGGTFTIDNIATSVDVFVRIWR